MLRATYKEAYQAVRPKNMVSITIRIEHSYYNSDVLCGAVTDLTKCFNTVQRKLLKPLFKSFGLPTSIAEQWEQV